MSTELSRREFLKASAAAGAFLLAGDLVSGRTMRAQGSVKIPETEKVIVTILVDNYYDLTAPDQKIAKRHRIAPQIPIFDMGLHAEHGLAYHIEVVTNGIPASFLFDFGMDFQGVNRNCELVKLDFSKVEALALSHGHFDHWGTLVDLIKTRKSVMHEGTPLYFGEDAFIERYSKRPDGVVRSLSLLRRSDIEALGVVKLVEIKTPTQIVSGAYATGKIEMVTEYEKGQPSLLIKQGDQYIQDFFVGEQAMVMNLKGKGLIVLSGCAHRGIVNAVIQAQKISGIEKVHAVIGGFHLTNAKPEIIQKTIADIKALSPEYIVPTHCTGFPATTAFSKEMPEQFVLSTVGTHFIFTV
jgi:7,8-dihydropterin-6-yl-methyl-4-(beta-D-ribofuranosyl)aminobenzene 5'-phosphate synthase